jgi:ribonuclease HI
MSEKGVVLPEKGQLFAILVSTSWHLIWNMHHHYWVIENPGRVQSLSGIHNQCLNAINMALMHDWLLTDKVKFGPLAFNKQLVLNTWSGLLMEEASLPDDWMHEGVLVGMRPMIDRDGIG